MLESKLPGVFPGGCLRVVIHNPHRSDLKVRCLAFRQSGRLVGVCVRAQPGERFSSSGPSCPQLPRVT